MKEIILIATLNRDFIELRHDDVFFILGEHMFSDPIYYKKLQELVEGGEKIIC